MVEDNSQTLIEMQQQLVSISNTVGQIQATLIENARYAEKTQIEFKTELTELRGAVRLAKEETASKSDMDAAFDKIRILEDGPKNAALERQQTIVKWVLAPIGVIIGGWVLFMLTKIGLAPPK